MQEYISLVSNVGFPIALVFYLMFRFEKTLKDNTKTIQELTYLLKSINGKRGNS